MASSADFGDSRPRTPRRSRGPSSSSISTRTKIVTSSISTDAAAEPIDSTGLVRFWA